MQIRSFRVPFSRLLEGTETPDSITFEAGDYLRVRPLFTLPTRVVRDIRDRLTALGDNADEQADALALDLYERCILEWHLEGPDGPIPMPTTPAELNELPGSVRGALFSFLLNYAGDGPDPTPAG